MSILQDLWLHVESDEFAVSCPKRFRERIRIYPADRLIAIDEEVLRWGVFVGAARACQLRLKMLPTLFSQFGIRFDSELRWRLMGFNGDVFHNGYELKDRTVILNIDDTIICDPYLLRVVPCPDHLLQELVEQMVSPKPNVPSLRMERPTSCSTSVRGVLARKRFRPTVNRLRSRKQVGLADVEQFTGMRIEQSTALRRRVIAAFKPTPAQQQREVFISSNVVTDDFSGKLP